MKKILLIAIMTFAGMLSSCSKPAEAAATPESVELSIKGMTCQSCVDSITSAVGKLPGVQSCEVNLEQESATVSFQSKNLTPEQIQKRISQLGFDAALLDKDSSL